MANHINDQFAFVINNSIYSSVQEQFLLGATFARESDTFSDAITGKSPFPASGSGGGHSGRRGGSGNEIGDLGFGGEIDASEVLLESGEKVKIVRPLRCVPLDGGGELGFDRGVKGVEFVENVVIESVEDGERRVEVEGVENVVIEDVEDGEHRVEVESVSIVETDVIEIDEEGGNCEKVDDGMSKDGEIGNVDTEVVEVVDEGDEHVEVEGVGYLETEVIEVDEVDENRVDVGNVDIEVDEVDEKGGNFEKVDKRTSKDDEMTEGVGYVVAEMIKVDEDGGNCEMEIGNVVIDLTGGDVGGTPVKVDDICDLDDRVIGFEKGSEIFKMGDRVVKNNGQQEDDCAKVDGEKVVMEDIVVEEVNNTSTNDNGDASKNLPNEYPSREENTSINKEQVTGKKRKLPRSMLEQWGSRLGNGESCSKDASFNENESEKSLENEASLRCILDALKFLVGDKSYNGKEGDFLETAKKQGMTFPRPRFRPSGQQ